MSLPPGFVPPCLPIKAVHPPSGEPWLHEIKHDGFRIIARKDGMYCGPVLRHPAELMLPAVDLGGRVWLDGRSCKGGPAAPAFGG